MREEAQEAQEVAGGGSAADAAERFELAARAALDAFNRGDMEAAWGWLPEDFEYHPIPDWPDSRVARGPEETIRYFRDHVRDVFDDWKGELESVTQLAGDTYLTHLRMAGEGRVAGIPTGANLFQVWEMDGERPVRVREFLDRGEALRAAGLEP